MTIHLYNLTFGNGVFLGVILGLLIAAIFNLIVTLCDRD
jgi:hypothetical protein